MRLRFFIAVRRVDHGITFSGSLLRTMLAEIPSTPLLGLITMWAPSNKVDRYNNEPCKGE